MAHYPKAIWRGADPHNYSTQAIQHKFIVIHVESGTESGTNGWFHNPKAQVSAHFGNPKVGKLDQFVDTNQMAYHCASWNGLSIGIEHEGNSGDHLNANQLENLKELLQWLHQQYNIPLVYTANAHDPKGGVIAHGKIPEGPLSHPNCPGNPIIADVQKLLDELEQTK